MLKWTLFLLYSNSIGYMTPASSARMSPYSFSVAHASPVRSRRVLRRCVHPLPVVRLLLTRTRCRRPTRTGVCVEVPQVLLQVRHPDLIVYCGWCVSRTFPYFRFTYLTYTQGTQRAGRAGGRTTTHVQVVLFPRYARNLSWYADPLPDILHN